MPWTSHLVGLNATDLTALAERVVPILVFLMAITVVTELCDQAGVFDAAATKLATLSGGRTAALFAMVAVLGSALSIVMSLDTTAVLLTPIVIALALRLRLSPLPFVLLTVYLANSASLLLPVSNLTNLLAATTLHDINFAALMWAPAVAAIVVPTLAIWLRYGRTLPSTFTSVLTTSHRDPVFFWVSTVTCIALGPLFISGIEPAFVAVGTAALLCAVALWRQRSAFAHVGVPWKMSLAMAALFSLVELLQLNGLGAWLAHATGATGTSWVDLLRLAGVGALASNVLNNLPAYLALEPTATGSPVRLAALLIGTNAGPMILLWGSLATILWRSRCAARGVVVSLRQFTVLGLWLVPVTVVAAVSALWLAH